MKRFLAIAVISAIAPISGAAQAVEFPAWSFSQVCEAGDASCIRFEQRTRGEISGTWRTLPPKQQTDCIAETEKIEPSYRLLQTCLANAMQELMKGQTNKAPGGKIVQLTPEPKKPAPPAAPAPAPVAPVQVAPVQVAPAPAEPAPQSTTAPPQ